MSLSPQTTCQCDYVRLGLFTFIMYGWQKCVGERINRCILCSSRETTKCRGKNPDDDDDGADEDFVETNAIICDTF